MVDEGAPAEPLKPSMDAMSDHVLGQIGLHLDPAAACGSGLHLHLDPMLFEDDGHLDFGVLGLFLDMASSQVGVMRPFVHADISIHRIARPTGRVLAAEPTTLRQGRRTSIVHVAVRDEHGVHVADSTQQLAFPGAAPAEPPASEHADEQRSRFFSRFDGRCTLPGRLHDIIGITDDVGPDGAPCWTMPIGPSSRNGYGGLHGGVAFDLVTEAATRAATGAVGAVEAKSALLRYLAPANIGPFRAVPTVLPQEDGSVFVRVAVLDLGADSLLCILGEVHLAARR
jgi:acyl-coenzyme A thioesterase PaaI-like protein